MSCSCSAQRGALLRRKGVMATAPWCRKGEALVGEGEEEEEEEGPGGRGGSHYI